MRIVLIILILLMAVGAAFFVLQSASQQQQVKTVVDEAPEVRAVSILVARDRIPVGTTITEEMIDQQPWPAHLLLSGFIRSAAEDANVVGMVTRSDFQPQEPISRFKIANPNDASFIAAALPKGMRAITLEVDTVSGVAGYVFPGDRVDIVLTHKIPDAFVDKEDAAPQYGARNSNAAKFAETVLRDIKVMAVEIRGLADFQSSSDQRRQPQAPTNLTVQVTPEQAQAVRLAEKNGSMTLALRSLEDKGGTGSYAVTGLTDLTGVELKGGTKAQERNQDVYIVRGVKTEGPKKGAGGAPRFSPYVNQE